MKMRKISKHLLEDRMQRVMVIMERTGHDYGEDLFSCPSVDDKGRPAIMILTDKGIMLCVNLQDVIVTMYVPTPNQVRRLYKKERMPEYIYNIVDKNQKRFADIIKHN